MCGGLMCGIFSLSECDFNVLHILILCGAYDLGYSWSRWNEGHRARGGKSSDVIHDFGPRAKRYQFLGDAVGRPMKDL